jgi:hypothetical protein
MASSFNLPAASMISVLPSGLSGSFFCLGNELAIDFIDGNQRRGDGQRRSLWQLTGPYLVLGQVNPVPAANLNAVVAGGRKNSFDLSQADVKPTAPARPTRSSRFVSAG